MQEVATNLNSNTFFLLTYDKTQFITTLQLQSVNMLKFVIERDQQNCYPSCCVCLDDFDKIIKNNQKLILTNCNHLLCQYDYQQLQKKNKNKSIKCVLCRSKIYQIIELDVFQEQDQLPNQIQLRVVGFQRIYASEFQNQSCKNCIEGLKVIIRCQFCNKPDSSYCVTCLTPQYIEFIKKQYQKVIFYCGCSFSLNLFSFVQKQTSEIEKLSAFYQSDPESYLELLIKQINIFQRQQILDCKQIYCPICPLKISKLECKKKEHIKNSHLDVYHMMYPQSVICVHCKASYANEQTLAQHQKKCRQV